jgi:sugar/nucleoside kinase (ribokinase family)
MRTDLGAAATLAPEDLAPADFAGVTHVHLEGYLLFNAALVRAILSGAKAAGCTVSLDLASFEVVRATMKILKEILGRYIDIVFANEDEAAAFAGGAGPREALAVLGKICPTAVVKIGREGAWLQHGGETVQVAAERVEAVDTTGAGDLWQAGFLYGFLQGRPLAQCGRYGAILGAEVVQIMGAAIPAERWPEIRRRVKQP